MVSCGKTELQCIKLWIVILRPGLSFYTRICKTGQDILTYSITSKISWKISNKYFYRLKDANEIIAIFFVKFSQCQLKKNLQLSGKTICCFFSAMHLCFEQAQPKVCAWQTPMKAKTRLALQSWIPTFLFAELYFKAFYLKKTLTCHNS